MTTVPADAPIAGRMTLVEGLLEARGAANATGADDAASTTYVLRAHGVAVEKPDA